MTDPAHTPPQESDGRVVSLAGPSEPRRVERRRRSVGWRSGDIVRAAALIIALYVFVQLLWFANELVLLTFLGVLFGLAVSAGVDHLQRLRVPRGLGAALIVFSFFVVLYSIGALVAPTIGEQARELKTKLPEAVERVEGWINQRPGLISSLFRTGDSTAAAARLDTAAAAAAAQGAARQDTTVKAPSSAIREGLSRQLSSAARYLFPFLTSTFTVIAALLLLVMLSIYIGAEPDLYHAGLMHLFPHRMRARAGEVLSAMATVLRRWLITQLIAMLTIGIVTTIVLLILGVNAPFALGTIAGLLEFIPTIGPIMSAVPAIAMGFLDSPEKALSVALASLAIQ
jgi:predicted PurR-regulated permease PerM